MHFVLIGNLIFFVTFMHECAPFMYQSSQASSLGAPAECEQWLAAASELGGPEQKTRGRKPKPPQDAVPKAKATAKSKAKAKAKNVTVPAVEPAPPVDGTTPSVAEPCNKKTRARAKAVAEPTTPAVAELPKRKNRAKAKESPVSPNAEPMPPPPPVATAKASRKRTPRPKAAQPDAAKAKARARRELTAVQKRMNCLKSVAYCKARTEARKQGKTEEEAKEAGRAVSWHVKGLS